MIDKNKMAPDIWKLCDEIYHKNIKLNEGKAQMFDKHQLRQTSFHFYYYAYKGMLDGTYAQEPSSLKSEIICYIVSMRNTELKD